MPSHPATSDLGLGDLAFALASLLALALLVPVQFASLVLFDATGLDVLVPDFVFMAVVPALAVSLLPAVAARRRYSPRATRTATAVSFVVAALLATYTTQFYGMCGGPGC